MNKRPWELLPILPPSEHEETPTFFYENVVKHLVKDNIKIMCTGITINQEAVENLRVTIDEVLETVKQTLADNPLIQKFQEERYPKLFAKFKEETLASVRDVDYYIKEYNPKNPTHRTYVVNTYLCKIGRAEAIRDKWNIRDIKQYNLFAEDSTLDSIIRSDLDVESNTAKEGMIRLAEEKVSLWNKVRTDKVDKGITVPDFNPASDNNKRDFFKMLGIEPLAFSTKTGEASWKRKYIEEVLLGVEDEDLKTVLNAFIDHSFGAIIRSNFLAAFDSYTIDGVLHGNYKLLGAKSARNTSSQPNMLNAPSSASIYAKPLKKCFVAPEGFIVAGVDLDQLEDRVITNITGDKAKLAIFEHGYDSHMYNAIHYGYPELDHIKKEFYELPEGQERVDLLLKAKKEFDSARSKSKNVTFKLAYLGFPDVHKGGVITQEIFDNYHDLYSGLREYREKNIIPIVQEQGYLHLGLGFRIYSDDVESDIRTLNNAYVQFYSIITLITINEINYQIEQAGYENDIQVTSTIYDSIYFNVREDPVIIKWLNDKIIPIMTTPIFKKELIGNTAALDVGLNWSEMETLSNDASIEEINEVLEKINDRS